MSETGKNAVEDERSINITDRPGIILFIQLTDNLTVTSFWIFRHIWAPLS